MQNKYVIKATGEREEFNPQKLRDSLSRAGANSESIEKIVEQIEGELKDGDATSDIYIHAFNLLKKEESPATARYSIAPRSDGARTDRLPI